MNHLDAAFVEAFGEEDAGPWEGYETPERDVYVPLGLQGRERLIRTATGDYLLVVERTAISGKLLDWNEVADREEGDSEALHVLRTRLEPSEARRWLLRHCIPPGLRGLFES